MSELLDRFRKAIGEKEFRVYHEAFSPFLANVSWSNQVPLAMYAASRDREMFMFFEDYSFLSQEIFRRYLAQKVTLSQLEGEFMRYAETVKAKYERFVGDDLTKWAEAELCVEAKGLREGVAESIGHTLYIETFDSEEVIGVLGEDVRERVEEMWPMMSDPVFESFVMRKKRIIWEGFRETPNPDTLAVRLRYLFIDYTAAMKLPDIRKEIEVMFTDPPAREAEIAEYGRELREKQKKYQEWLATLDGDDRRMAEYCQFVMRLRDIRKDTIAQTETVSYIIGQELFRRAGIETVLVLRVLMQEIENGVEWLRENKERFQKRLHGFEVFMITRSDTCEVRETPFELLKKDAEHFLHERDERVRSDRKTFSGQSAFRGLVRGRVRVIIDPRKNEHFEKGDILVTGMTRPDFVSLMERAAAIVTNEGGITCHAAIIARELKKPCIIGTKIATQVLKDGMMVEVDADKGVVRILEKG